MLTHSRELIFIYNSQKRRDRVLLARAKAVNLLLNAIDVKKIPLPPTYFAELIWNWEIPCEDLLDPTRAEQLERQNPHSILKLITYDTSYLRTPIAIKGKEYRFVEKTSDLQGLENFVNPFAEDYVNP